MINKLSFMFTLILYIIEFLHAVIHLAVLLGLYKVWSGNILRMIYFTSDLLTVLLSYYIINKNGILVLVHMIIHLRAILHLFGIKSQIYTNIFKYIQIGRAKVEWSKLSHEIILYNRYF